MPKQLCIIGPQSCGKTIFIYHMNFKLVLANDDGHLKRSFKDLVTNHFAPEIAKQIHSKNWINPTDPNAIGPDTQHPQLVFRRNTFMRSDLVLDIPDVAGEIFQDIIAAPDPQHEGIITSIDNADGYIIMLDASTIKDKKLKQQAINFYTTFTINFRDFCNLRNSRCTKPTLVLLNKSDVYFGDPKKQYASEGAKEYLRKELPNLYMSLVNTFQREHLLFAWHSNISAVINNGSGNPKPDYDAFYAVDEKLYTQNIIELVQRMG